MHSEIPVLPVERFAARIEIECDTSHSLLVERVPSTHDGGDCPDCIGIWANHYHAGMSHNVSFLFSPALLVHIANTLLTDNERAQIHHAPALAGSATE